MLNIFFFVFIKSKFLNKKFVPFYNFVSRKPNRYSCLSRVIVDQMAYSVYTTMNRSTMSFFITKILSKWLFLVLGHMDSVFYKLINTRISSRRNWHNRNTKHSFHLVHIDCSTVGCNLVHHIKSDNHRYIHFNELHRQIQITFDISSINNINQSLRLLVQNKISRNKFFATIW